MNEHEQKEIVLDALENINEAINYIMETLKIQAQANELIYARFVYLETINKAKK